MEFKNAAIIVEGYNFTNADEVYNALEANQIGVKTQPEYKEKIKWDYTCEKLKIFFRKCEEYGIKDTTYGVQLLLSKVPPNNLENIIRTDGFYELLKSRKKPWVKELKEFQTLMNDKVWLGATVNDLQVFEKAVQEGQSKHGKAAKGSGDIEGVKTLYDDGTWKLMQPTSFAGEKAAAFYIKDGKETPTEWCTRCEEGYYRRYTKQAPLYIIRNMKTGKSYQMAFEEDRGWNGENYIKVHFLDQNDVKGDEITQGDLSKIPNELLKHIPIPVGKAKGKTMADYNIDEGEADKNANVSGYIKNDKETWSKEQIVDKKYQREIAKKLDENGEGNNPHYYERFSDVDIAKIISIHGSFKEAKKLDSLTHYVESGKKIKNDYSPKAKKVRYYFLNHPEEYVEIIASNKAGISPVVNKATTLGYGRTILQFVGFCDLGVSIPTKALSKLNNTGEKTDFASKSIIRAANRKYEEVTKKETEFNRQMQEYATKKLSTIFPQYKFLNMDIYSFRSRKLPKETVKLDRKINNSGFFVYGNNAPGTKWNICINRNVISRLGKLYVEFDKIPLKKENMKIWFEPEREEFKTSEELKNICFNISQYIFNSWRKQFHGEIVQNRAEGNYKKNMYEDIRSKFAKLI